MRVTRALDKLQILLKHRGVAISATALGAALATEAATAAPVGLAVSLAGTALAGSAAGGGSVATLIKIGIMGKLKAGIIGAVIIAGAAVSLVVQQQAQARLREQDESLRQQSEQLAQLVTDNERLSNLVAQANDSKDRLSDLLKLRTEVELIGKQTNDLAMVQKENRRLQQRPQAKPKTPLEIVEERTVKARAERNWLLAFKLYAMDHQDQFPTNFEQAKSFLQPESNGETNMAPDQFEIVYQGPDNLTNPSEVIVLRERQPSQDSVGNWYKVYGMADGSVQTVSVPSRWTVGGKEIDYDTLEAFEKDHITTVPRK
jgi:hypothetical protein